MDRARKGLLLLTAVVCTGSVLLRFYLSMTRANLDHSLAWRLVDFFSYFTITTNILAAVVAWAGLLRPASPLARPSVVAATAVYILVVGATYQLLLRREAHGLDLVADLGLHAVAPVLFILLWLAFTPKAELVWSRPAGWVIYPFAYMAWILARGAAIHRYPYFFANVDRLGYPHALLNGALFLAGFYLLGLGAVALGRMGRRSQEARAAA